MNVGRLSKLVFIKYNKALYERFQARRLRNNNEDFDPICVDELNYNSEWMTENRELAMNLFMERRDSRKHKLTRIYGRSTSQKSNNHYSFNSKLSNNT